MTNMDDKVTTTDAPTSTETPSANSPEASAAPSGPTPHGITGTPGTHAGDAAPQPPAANEPPFSRVDGGDDALRRSIVEMLRTCYDPEIPVDIWELGLVYRVDIDEDGNVAVQMTLTSPMCPVAGSLPPEVERKIAGVQGVRDARVDRVWEPTWNKDMMSEAAQVKLNLI